MFITNYISFVSISQPGVTQKPAYTPALQALEGGPPMPGRERLLTPKPTLPNPPARKFVPRSLLPSAGGTRSKIPMPGSYLQTEREYKV